MLFPIHHRVLTRERIGEGKKRKREGKQNLRESKRSREATRRLANKPSESNTSYRRGGLRSEAPNSRSEAKIENDNDNKREISKR